MADPPAGIMSLFGPNITSVSALMLLEVNSLEDL